MRLSSLLSDVDSNITLVLSSTRVRLQNLELQVRPVPPSAFLAADHLAKQTALTTLSLGAGTALAGFFGGSPCSFSLLSLTDNFLQE